MKKPKNRYFLSIYRCPHGSRAILLDYDTGGTRLTSVKCCGRWHLEQQFGMSELSLKLAIQEFQAAVRNVEKG